MAESRGVSFLGARRLVSSSLIQEQSLATTDGLPPRTDRSNFSTMVASPLCAGWKEALFKSYIDATFNIVQ